MVSSRDGATSIGKKEDLGKDMDQMVDLLRTPKNGHKASRSLKFEVKGETPKKRQILPKASPAVTRRSCKPDVGSTTKLGRKSGRESREEETRRSSENGCQRNLKDFPKNKKWRSYHGTLGA